MHQHAEGRDLPTLVEEFIEAYNSKNFEDYRRFLSDEFFFCHHNRGWESHDPDAFVAGLKNVPLAVPDRRLGPAKRIVQQGNVVVREQSWEGTAVADVPQFAAKGESFSVDFCSIFVFESGRIREYHEYG